MEDALQLGGLVELHVRGEAEAVAQRRRQQPGPGGGADQGERRQLERDGRGARALADDDVDPEVLHRHVEHLLGGPGHPVDLVEEEDLALLEGGEDRGQVAGVLDGGPGGDPDRGAHLSRDDHGEGGLAEAGGAGEQDMVGGGAACEGRLAAPGRAARGPAPGRRTRPALRTQRRLDGLVLAVGGRRRRAARRGGVGRVVGRRRPVSSAECHGVGRESSSASGASRRAVSGCGSGSAGLPCSSCATCGARPRPARPRPAAPRRRPPRRPRAPRSRGRSARRAAGRASPAVTAVPTPCRPTCAPTGSPSLSLSSSRSFCAPFLPMPGTAVSAFSSPVATASRSASGRVHGEHRLGEPGADPARGLQQLEDLALVVVGEAVEGERVLADDQGGRQPGLLADPQPGERARRALDGHADAADLDHGRGRGRARRPGR